MPLGMLSAQSALAVLAQERLSKLRNDFRIMYVYPAAPTRTALVKDHQVIGADAADLGPLVQKLAKCTESKRAMQSSEPLKPKKYPIVYNELHSAPKSGAARMLHCGENQPGRRWI